MKIGIKSRNYVIDYRDNDNTYILVYDCKDNSRQVYKYTLEFIESDGSTDRYSSDKPFEPGYRYDAL